MTQEQWNVVKKAAACQTLDQIPVGLIVDSPWIPGYCGVSTKDYYTDIGLWMDCYKKIKSDFPEMILIPDWWVEFGMAAESAAFGCCIDFYDYQPATIEHIIEELDDLETLVLPDPNPENNGYMSLAINYYKKVAKALEGTDERITMVASRGPLNIASFIMSVPNLCVALKTNPDELHSVLKKTTKLVIKWLKAQMNVLSDAEGILVLDDICGFLSEDDYLEFAHPYLKEIYDSFDVPVKMFHNDNFGNGYTTFPYIKDLGVNIFNFSHMADIIQARKALGEDVCIFGNIPPRDVLGGGTTEEIQKSVLELLEKYGSTKGLILSAGGGASPGMSKENCDAMISAVKMWNSKK